MAFKTERWTLANILPVMFVSWIIFTIWSLHFWFHVLHLLQSTDAALHSRGVWQGAVSQGLTVMFLICFYLAISTDPGSVPKTPEWNVQEAGKIRFTLKHEAPNTEEKEKPLNLELKQTGERRFCKWCDHYKPDRCHHCRVCRSCILRMDHHCPWIANCVGFKNHKAFFLLVLYALSACVFICVTMWESVMRASTDEMLAFDRFCIVFGTTLSTTLGVLLTVFFAIHVALMLRAQTTIEYCEKRTKWTAKMVVWDEGVYTNVTNVLGTNPLLWFVPIAPPFGEGTSFENAKKANAKKAPLVKEASADSVPAAANGAAPVEVAS